VSGVHRYAARRDPHEALIISALRRAGAMVWQVSAEGLPDLLVGFRKQWTLLEVKAPLGPDGGASKGGQKLKPAQQRFFDDAELGELPAHVVRDEFEALKAIGVEVVKR
jgi:hypothetical protein